MPISNKMNELAAEQEQLMRSNQCLFPVKPETKIAAK